MRSATACFLACLASTAQAGGTVNFGLADEFTLSQPIVQTRVGTFDTLLNEYLLDTGASGILVGAAASSELTGSGLETVATYTDFGVAGPQATRVSRPYDFSFAGSDGVPLTLPGTRFQTSSGNFAFYSGIAGMPLMMNRTVGLDLSAQTDMEGLRIGVSFGSGLPPATGRHYSVPLSMYEFPLTGQAHPDDPLPVSAPLPFLPVRLGSGTYRLDGRFLLDTGAQQCILSSRAAIDLGLDTNGNGTLEDEAESFQTVAGVGGTVEIPVLTVGSLALRAAGGIDLGFGAIKVGIIDIDPAISGVLGMNILNSGWEMHALQLYLGMDSGPPGVFDRVDLDFRTAAATLQGEMRLTVNEQRLASAGWAVAAGSVLTLGDGVPETIATLANEGLVDVGASRVTVTSGLTAETVAAWIVAGRNGGTWDGAAGITSSSAAAAADRAVGWRDNGDGSFTIAFAAAGDLDLNGLFDFDDVLAVVSAGRYDTALPATWAQGDYDYNGVVDFDDLLAMVSAGLFDTGAYAATPLQLGPVSAVPEPATWIAAAFGAALAALAGRRAAARERAVNGQVGQGYFRKHRPSGA